MYSNKIPQSNNKLAIEAIKKKLNFIEQKILSDYLVLETSKIAINHQTQLEEEITTLRRLTNKAWDSMDECLSLAMREHRISKERIESIFRRLAELMKKTDAERWFNVDEIPSHDYEIVIKDEFRDMISELIECKCKGCIDTNKGCNIYGILKRHKIEPPTGYQRKCKYGC